MELSSRYLIGAVIGACGGCAAALTPAAANAQTNNSNPVVPLSATQSPYQPNPSENILARMSLRMTELENEIRRLTGENEELTYRLGQLEESVRKSASDTELRLKTLESGAAPAAPGAANQPLRREAVVVCHGASSASFQILLTNTDPPSRTPDGPTEPRRGRCSGTARSTVAQSRRDGPESHRASGPSHT